MMSALPLTSVHRDIVMSASSGPIASRYCFHRAGRQVCATKTNHRRPRQSDPWFDADCRAAKRLTRRLERTVAKTERHGDNADATDALEAWRAQRRVYRDLLRRKREGFWQSTVEAQRTNPRQLWKLSLIHISEPTRPY